MTGPSAVLGIWLHSHEEDTASESVYRPRDHPFPRSRGRSGLEFREDGTVVEYRVGADDRAGSVAGSWRDLGDGRYSISFPDVADRTLRYDGNTLRLRR